MLIPNVWLNSVIKGIFLIFLPLDFSCFNLIEDVMFDYNLCSRVTDSLYDISLRGFICTSAPVSMWDQFAIVFWFRLFSDLITWLRVITLPQFLTGILFITCNCYWLICVGLDWMSNACMHACTRFHDDTVRWRMCASLHNSLAAHQASYVSIVCFRRTFCHEFDVYTTRAWVNRRKSISSP